MKLEQTDIGRVLALRDEFERRGTRFASVTIARGGSRRFPRKNAAPVCGRPLVEWSILQSRCSHLVTDVYLSTDDEEIAEIGRKAGAKIIWRYEYSDDIAGNIPFAHAIRQIREWHPVDLILCVLPTNPVRHPWDFDEAAVLSWEIRKRDRKFHEIIPIVPASETIVHKKLDETRSEAIIGDKKFGYLDAAGSCWNIADPDWYLAYAAGAPAFDSVIDTGFVQTYHIGPAWEERQWLYYYLTESYQRFDIDYPEQVSLIEDMMRRYILTSPTVYEDYKKEGENARDQGHEVPVRGMR